MRMLKSQRFMYLAVWLAGGFFIASYYNACGQVSFEKQLSSDMVNFKSAGVILINKDAPFTNSQSVELDLDDHGASEMYVTNAAGCASGGQWEPYTATKAWLLAGLNQQTTVYAKFRNTSEGVLSDCVSDSIIHDNQKPLVVLQQPTMVTNVATPVVQFVASDSLSGLDKMYCQWPGGAVQECNFSTANGNLSEGRYLVAISATDKAGNYADPIYEDLTVDRTPPVITILSGPAATSNVTLANYSFNVTDDRSGVKSVECAFDNKGNYASCSSPNKANLAEGAHHFYVRAYDNAGNVSESQNDFSIDLSAPTVTITSSPSDYSSSASGTFTFTGDDDGKPLASYQCKIDSGAYASCSSPKTYSGLADGVHTFSVIGFDGAGNVSAPATRSWYVDTKGPVIAFILEPKALSSSTTAVYKYTITDAGSGVASAQCSLDSGAFSNCALDSSTLTGLAAGKHTFQVKALDKAGNSSLSDLRSFTIDLTPPSVRFTAVPVQFTNQKDFTFTFVATDDNGVDHVDCKLDGAAYAACSSLTAQTVAGMAEGNHSFTIRAVDKAGNNSPDVSTTFTIDLTPPVISYFQMPPASSLFGATITLGFTVTDSVSGVASTSCTLDGVSRTCSSGATANLTGLASGNHSFVVVSTDVAGNQATDTRTISVSSPVLKNQNVEVTGNSKVDILVIMDNSGSMADEMANMSARIGNFMANLKNLDWQVAIVTTDTSSNAALKDGRFVPLKVPSGTNYPAGQYILRSTDDPVAAQNVFAASVKMATNGSANEYGFKAAIRAMARGVDASQPVNAPNNQFFRQGAGLAMLVVSDAHDDSGTTPENVIAAVKSNFGADKNFVWHSIVVPESSYTNPNASKPDPRDPCKDSRESVQYDGRDYMRLSAMTGGVQGNECLSDYGSQLTDMGRVTAELVSSATLNCVPLDMNGDGVVDARDVIVTSTSGQAIPAYTVNGTKVTFSSGLPIGTNQVQYYCVQ